MRPCNHFSAAGVHRGTTRGAPKVSSFEVGGRSRQKEVLKVTRRSEVNLVDVAVMNFSTLRGATLKDFREPGGNYCV